MANGPSLRDHDGVKRHEHACPWPSPKGSSFGDLLECVLSGLRQHGLAVPRDRLVFACMPSLSRRGLVPPPEDLLLDEPAAGRHYEALVRSGCLVIEVRGAGWLVGRRYLVLLDHAWGGGSLHPHLEAWAEERGTVWPLSVAQFERLERDPRLRPLLHRISKRRWRQSMDIPVRPLWHQGEPAAEQGCPDRARSGTDRRAYQPSLTHRRGRGSAPCAHA